MLPPAASFPLPPRVLLSASVRLGNTDVLKYSRADCTSLQDYVKVMGFDLKLGPPTSSVYLTWPSFSFSYCNEGFFRLL